MMQHNGGKFAVNIFCVEWIPICFQGKKKKKEYTSYSMLSTAHFISISFIRPGIFPISFH